MKRSEITKFLSRLLEKSRFSGPGKYWAREVSLDYEDSPLGPYSA